MKQIKNILVSAMALLLITGMFSACADDFLDTKPTDAYDEADVLSTTSGLIGAVNGIHKALYKQYNKMGQSGQGGINILIDCLGEDLVWSAIANEWFVSELRWYDHRDKNGLFTFHAYQFYYILVSNANKILDAADDAVGSDTERNIAKGQALAYRAYGHFGAIQLYASRYASDSASKSGIPLLLSYTTEPQERATIEQVYAQIEQDLKEATVLLDGFGRLNKTHLDVTIVQGLQARVALAKGDYTQAKEYAKAARTSFVAGGGRLMTGMEYKDGFKDASNPEWMWGSIIVNDQTLYFYAFTAFLSYNFNSTNILSAPKCINSLLYAQINSSDIRHSMWEANPDATNFPLPTSAFKRFPYMSRKFAVADAGSSVADIVYMRLAEMYLIEAEAKANLGEADAAALLNELIVTRDPDYDAAAGGRPILEEVLIQRRIELWGEGFRFTDLKRLNQPLDRMGANHDEAVCVKMREPAGTKEWVFHFPIKEENANPHIKENPNP